MVTRNSEKRHWMRWKEMKEMKEMKELAGAGARGGEDAVGAGLQIRFRFATCRRDIHTERETHMDGKKEVVVVVRNRDGC